MASSREYLALRAAKLSQAWQKQRVYIGLDFGTTFAKVAYEVAPTTGHFKRSVTFGTGDMACFHPTELYFNSSDCSLSFSKGDSVDESVVRYFKYSMVVDGLEKNEALNRCKGLLSNNPERLCSAFYLACLIALVRAKICKAMDVSNPAALDWYINMGIPVGKTVGNNPHVKPVYDEVLQVAWAWANSEHAGKNKVSLKVFDGFYTAARKNKAYNLNTVPELYAEVLMYQQDNNVPEGFYAVIDVGGGTVDLAVFLKQIIKGEGAKVYCIAHEVSAEGVESIVSRVSDDVNPAITNKVRDCLLNNKVDFVKLSDIQLSDPRITVSYRSRRLIQAIKNFKSSYGSCLAKARENKFTDMRREVENGGVLRYFMMGGGKGVHFYNCIIKHMINVQCMAWKTMVQAERSEIRYYLKQCTNLEYNDNDRLLISQMLAQPFDNIPGLDGMPWDFIPASPVVGLAKVRSFSDELEDRQRELYGDD